MAVNCPGVFVVVLWVSWHSYKFYVCIVVVLVVLCVYCFRICCTVCELLHVCVAGFTLDAELLAVKSVFGRSCDRPPRHRFFLVSLCL